MGSLSFVHDDHRPYGVGDDPMVDDFGDLFKVLLNMGKFCQYRINAIIMNDKELRDNKYCTFKSIKTTSDIIVKTKNGILISFLSPRKTEIMQLTTNAYKIAE